jgi:heme/copper-type cytochrome/quinol oxidase subunit 3
VITPTRVARDESVASINRVWVPALLLPFAYMAVTLALSMFVLPSGFYVVVAVTIGTAAVLSGNQLIAWLLPVALGTAGATSSGTGFFVLLAGLHLLHMLGGLSRLVPFTARIELAALAAPFRRYTVIQLFSQGFAFVALRTLSDTPKGPVLLPIAAAVVLGALALSLTRGAFERPGGGEQ